MNEPVRPTKKQREMLTFLETFIAEHGYSPSYREIMNALNYSSVATVALHIDNLIKRGHVRKRDRSARSLEVVFAETTNSVTAATKPLVTSNQVRVAEEKWLVGKVEHYFAAAEESNVLSQEDLDALYVLVGALKVLGLEGAAQSFAPRMAALKTALPGTQI